MDRVFLSWSLYVLLRRLVFRFCFFLHVQICGTSIFLAGDVYLKGGMTTQIMAAHILVKMKRALGQAHKGIKGSLVLYLLNCPPSTRANHCFFLGAASSSYSYPVGVQCQEAT